MQLPMAATVSLAGLAAAGVARLALGIGRRDVGDESGDGVPALDLAAWCPERPAQFYIPGESESALLYADAWALVEGVRLPLHIQVVCKQSGALRKVASQSPQVGGAGLDLSDAFKGSGLLEAACLLRLMYRPRELTDASFAGLAAAGKLEGVASLAHKLAASRQLRAIKAYLQGLTTRMAAAPSGSSSSVPELAAALAVAQKCSFSHASSGCLDAMADQLVTSGEHWPEGQEQALASACDSATLAQLLRRLSGKAARSLVRAPPTLFDVRPGGGVGGLTGGFTFAVAGFAKRAGAGSVLFSPWVEVGGFHWRLRVHPAGSGAGKGTHLSVFAQCDHTRALACGARSVAAAYSITVFDQGEGGRDFVALFDASCSSSGPSGPSSGGGSSSSRGAAGSGAHAGASRSSGSGSGSGSGSLSADSSAPGDGGGAPSGSADGAGSASTTPRPSKSSSSSGSSPPCPSTPCHAPVRSRASTGSGGSSGGSSSGPSGLRQRQRQAGVFNKQADTWGRHQLMPLEELRRRDRGFLKRDRLLLRLDLKVTSIEEL